MNRDTMSLAVFLSLAGWLLFELVLWLLPRRRKRPSPKPRPQDGFTQCLIERLSVRACSFECLGALRPGLLIEVAVFRGGGFVMLLDKDQAERLLDRLMESVSDLELWQEGKKEFLPLPVEAGGSNGDGHS